MGALNRTRCYLIGNMQYANGEGWRAKATAALAAMGVTAFDPYHKPFINEIPEDEKARQALHKWMDDGDFDRVAERMKQVRADDLRLCDVSDFLIVNLIPEIPSWGSAEELFWSNRMKKPIFLSVEGGKKKTPLWIMGTIPHKYIYDSPEEIIECLQKIDSGEKPMDNYRWKILQERYR